MRHQNMSYFLIFWLLAVVNAARTKDARPTVAASMTRREYNKLGLEYSLNFPWSTIEQFRIRILRDSRNLRGVLNVDGDDDEELHKICRVEGSDSIYVVKQHGFDVWFRGPINMNAVKFTPSFLTYAGQLAVSRGGVSSGDAFEGGPASAPAHSYDYDESDDDIGYPAPAPAHYNYDHDDFKYGEFGEGPAPAPAHYFDYGDFGEGPAPAPGHSYGYGDFGESPAPAPAHSYSQGGVFSWFFGSGPTPAAAHSYDYDESDDDIGYPAPAPAHYFDYGDQYFYYGDFGESPAPAPAHSYAPL